MNKLLRTRFGPVTAEENICRFLGVFNPVVDVDSHRCGVADGNELGSHECSASLFAMKTHKVKSNEFV